MKTKAFHLLVSVSSFITVLLSSSLSWAGYGTKNIKYIVCKDQWNRVELYMTLDLQEPLKTTLQYFNFKPAKLSELSQKSNGTQDYKAVIQKGGLKMLVTVSLTSNQIKAAHMTNIHVEYSIDTNTGTTSYYGTSCMVSDR